MGAPSRQILAISNSAALFAEPWQDPLIARYLASLTGKERPVICHIGAANGESADKTAKFFATAQRAGFEGRHLNLFQLESDAPDSYFAGVDAVYIDGGSTRNLRALLREWGVDEALRKAYSQGIVIAGASAGANILFEWGMTDSVRTRIEPIACLGILSGSISVHADARPDRNEAFLRHLSGANACYPAYALDDDTALHFVDNQLERALRSSEGAQVRRRLGNAPFEAIDMQSLKTRLPAT